MSLMPRPRKSENKRIEEAMFELRRADNWHSFGQIAAKFGVSRNVVLGIANRAGFLKSADVPKRLADSEHVLVRKPSPPRRFIWEKRDENK